MSGTVRSIYIFLGPPGSGKGSLSDLCVSKLGWLQLSVGNLCRKHIAEKTATGIIIKEAIEAGRLAPDELICEMVFSWFVSVEASGVPVILDGFPRTLYQAQLFTALLSKQRSNLVISVVKLVASDACIIERLSSRLICSQSNCQAIYSSNNVDLLNIAAKAQTPVCTKCGYNLIRRSDDNEGSVKERLNIYHTHEQKVLSFYESQNVLLHELDAHKPINIVFEEFIQLCIPKNDISVFVGGTV